MLQILLPIIATAFSAVSSIQAGKAQKAQYEAQAFREENAARQREIDRKRNLLKALASQNASRGAQGIAANQGSAAAMMRSDFDAAERDQTINAANAEFRIGQAKSAGDAALTQGQFTAASSLLDLGVRRVRTGKF